MHLATNDAHMRGTGAALLHSHDPLGRELLENLSGLQSVLGQLRAVAEEKLAAIRAAALDRLQSCTVTEGRLLADAGRNQAARYAIHARLAQQLRNPRLRSASLEVLAACFSEPLASSLRARGTALRQLGEQLREKNHLVADVAQRVLGHVRGVLSELAQATQETVGYGPRGRHENRQSRTLVDAVG